MIGVNLENNNYPDELVKQQSAEIERLKDDLKLLGDVKLLDMKRERAFEKQSAIISVLAEALEEISRAKLHRDGALAEKRPARIVAKDALEKLKTFREGK
jgi:hypothetical protein